MTSIRQQLLDLIVDPDAAYDTPERDLAPLQLRAAQELFELRRTQIPLVGKRAADAGMGSIHSFDDLVPLLFAHTVYKSYPPSFVEQGRWDRMLQWLNTLSVEDTTQVDVNGVNNVDDWIDRLWDAGHMVLATSGSSGKVSFLNHTRADQRTKTRHFRHSVNWPYVKPSNERALFWLGPIKGPNSAIESAIIGVENWGKPGETYSLTDEPLRISEVSRMALMRKKMTDGTATPGEIASFEAEAALKGAKAQAQLRDLAVKIIERRHQPMLISGLWAQHMAIIRQAREMGVGDGEFHPRTIINAGGGIKGVALPPDYKEHVAAFYGNVIRPGAYGMTEMAQVMPRCEAGRYHRAPALITLVLDPEGERLLKSEDAKDGLAEGRFAFLDLAYEGRWGGIITGDKVTVDFGERCPCGRSGPTFLDNISRFSQAGGDDHIGCAGTIDAYIRGAVAA
jgi:hypothetical protein